MSIGFLKTIPKDAAAANVEGVMTHRICSWWGRRSWRWGERRGIGWRLVGPAAVQGSSQEGGAVRQEGEEGEQPCQHCRAELAHELAFTGVAGRSRTNARNTLQAFPHAHSRRRAPQLQPTFSASAFVPPLLRMLP